MPTPWSRPSKDKNIMSQRIIICLAVFLLLLRPPLASSDLVQLNYDQPSGVTRRALFFTNDQVGTGTSAGLNFYTIGLDTQLALNVNIQKLQLGCGGVNGAGACDIDIDNASLTGTLGVNGCLSSGSTAGCDFVMTRPEITLAISNDGTPNR